MVKINKTVMKSEMFRGQGNCKLTGIKLTERAPHPVHTGTTLRQSIKIYIVDHSHGTPAHCDVFGIELFDK